MKTVEIADVSASDYGRRETWVLMRRGKPVAAVVPIRRGVDLESFELSHNPEFLAIINRSWKTYKETGGVSLDDMRRRHRIKPPAPRQRKAR
jgi:antitoxin (DNA-binding transcriptional repressor) of toxin-antitoxin stability system